MRPPSALSYAGYEYDQYEYENGVDVGNLSFFKIPFLVLPDARLFLRSILRANTMHNAANVWCANHLQLKVIIFLIWKFLTVWLFSSFSSISRGESIPEFTPRSFKSASAPEIRQQPAHATPEIKEDWFSRRNASDHLLLMKLFDFRIYSLCVFSIGLG